MRILAVSDQPSEYLWGPGVTQALTGVDLILSCGDLDPQYLSYLVSFTGAPLLYVHGNHDSRYDRDPPEGCRCVDDQLVTVGGLRVLGLGGSPRYSRESPYQFTEAEMRRRVRRKWLALHLRGGFDVLLTHAPAYGLGDGTDQAHVGFRVFRELLDKWQPALFVHGHIHLSYDRKCPRERQYNGTHIVNAYERWTFELDPGGGK